MRLCLILVLLPVFSVSARTGFSEQAQKAGKRLFEKGHYREAISEYRRALRYTDRSDRTAEADIHLYICLSYEKLNRYHHARTACEKSATTSEREKYHRFYARLYNRYRRYDKSLNFFSKVNKDALPPAERRVYAESLAGSGRKKDARRVLEENFTYKQPEDSTCSEKTECLAALVEKYPQVENLHLKLISLAIKKGDDELEKQAVDRYHFYFADTESGYRAPALYHYRHRRIDKSLESLSQKNNNLFNRLLQKKLSSETE